MSKSKAIFIALDGADPTLLQHMIDVGRLPAIKRLGSQGLSWRLRVPKALGNGVIWPTIHTGVNAGSHGRYYFRQIRNGSYDIVPFREDRDLKRRPFWEYLSSRGLRVAILDAYKAPLAGDLNGRQIADWLTHGFHPHSIPRSYPPGEIKRVLQVYGEDPIVGSVDDFVSANPDVYALERRLRERIVMRTRLCREWLQSNDWDLFFLTLSEAHCIGHRGWHMHDPNHPYFDPARVRKDGDPVESVYAALDEAIAELVADIGNETFVFLLTGIGMESDFSANSALNEILARLEKGAGRPQAPSVKTAYARYRNMLGRIKRIVLKSQRIRQQVQRLKAKGIGQGACIALPYDEHCGAIRFNLKGREPRGAIAPGDELTAFQKYLVNELRAIRYKGTGLPLVKEIVFKEELFTGELTDNLPDAFVIWNREQMFFTRDRPFTIVESPTLGEVSIPATARTGDHNEDAVFIAWQYGSRENGYRGETSPADMALVDVAPTICEALEQPLPDAEGCSQIGPNPLGVVLEQ